MSAPRATAPARAARVPPSLAPGARVRIVAPSGPCDRARLEAGLACLRAASLEPVHDAGVHARTGFLAGDDTRRAAELRAALADRDAAAIWIARGGYGATRLLPAIAPAVVAAAAAPRWLIGFSDATALHALFWRAGLVSLHGANVTTLAQWSDAARREMLEVLRGGEPAVLSGQTLVPGPVARGPVVGGNAAVLAAMTGTGFAPPCAGAIVLLEDVGEAPYRLDRILTQLLQGGVLEGAVGFAIGQLTGCDDPPRGADPRRGLDVVRERLGTLGVPVVAGLPIGHEASARAVPLGAVATLDPGAASLRFDPLRPGRAPPASGAP